MKNYLIEEIFNSCKNDHDQAIKIFKQEIIKTKEYLNEHFEYNKDENNKWFYEYNNLKLNVIIEENNKSYKIIFDLGIDKNTYRDELPTNIYQCNNVSFSLDYFLKKLSQFLTENIKDFYKTQNCVMLGVNGNSENTK
jgi:hypothetical protein